MEFSKKITSVPSETFLCSIPLVGYLYSEIGEKVENKVFHHETGVPDVCRYLRRTFEIINVKVWKKSFRIVPFRALCDKNSILWFAKFGDFR